MAGVTICLTTHEQLTRSMQEYLLDTPKKLLELDIIETESTLERKTFFSAQRFRIPVGLTRRWLPEEHPLNVVCKEMYYQRIPLGDSQERRCFAASESAWSSLLEGSGDQLLSPLRGAAFKRFPSPWLNGIIYPDWRFWRDFR